MLDFAPYLRMTDAELATQDIAKMNLACAIGLPGSEHIDAPMCLGALDEWAEHVRDMTEAKFDRFHADPDEFDRSEPMYRMAVMLLTLKEKCGLWYDPFKAQRKLTDPFDLNDYFIHAPIQGPGGTCGTLPVVFVAIERRLGYPVFLVQARGHLFVRWDDPRAGVRVNIESTVNGVQVYPDQHYRSWPSTFTMEDERDFGYLVSMGAREVLCKFIQNRGHHHWDCGNYRRAIAAYVLAANVDVKRAANRSLVRGAVQNWEQKLRGSWPPNCPRIEITLSPLLRRWKEIPWQLEQQIRYFETAEELFQFPQLERDLWSPLREGRTPEKIPERLVVDVTRDPCSTQP